MSRSESVLEKNTARKGQEGELTGFFSLYSGYSGPTACDIAHKKLRSNLKASKGYDSDQCWNLAESLEKAMLRTQGDIYEKWTDTGIRHGVHSTVVLVRDGHIVCSNAGGGSAVICRADGYIGMLTEASDRLDMIEKPSARVFGLDWEDEFIVIGCPEFWKFMQVNRSVNMAKAALCKYRDVKYASQKLASAALASGAKKDVSVMIILLNSNCAFSKSTANPNQDGTNSNLRPKLSLKGSDEMSISDVSIVSDSGELVPQKSLFRGSGPKAPNVFEARRAHTTHFASMRGPFM
eukprot:CAMPEP_0182447540 /NCGR_PEP_ID=MMETSP1172-20130603/17265_1 /TAXON_ID=708627 /ORGANISM="Timspurckia oligopyrenoides, Strain CCMP3278" /LENGTH=292 /DNA_ID=CAMNT_0024644021 /DNA_START=209 /DNA_END=1087 /DNA_ORIENTATION=+